MPWLAEPPAQWKVERAKWLFRKMERSARATDDVVTCFRDGMVTLRKNRRVTGFTESIKEIGYQGVREGDLVIHAMDAFAGAIGVSDSDGKCTPVYAVCQPAKDVNPHYYAHLVREMARTQWIAALAKGIRERSTDFRFEAFANQFLPVPPKEEQDRIATYLNYADRRINRLIRAKRRLIELLNEQKQAIIHRAVTRGLDPHVRLKPSGIDWLGDVPQAWAVRRLKFLFREIDERSSSGDETLLSLRMYEGLVPHADVSTRPIHSSDVVGFKRTQPGDVVMNRMRASIGLFGCATASGIVSPDYAVLRPAVPLAIDYYVSLFKIPALASIFRIESRGLGTGSSGFLRLYMDRFGRIAVPVPHPNEQAAISTYIAEATRGLAATQEQVRRELALVGEYRTRLIADVVTGKLDVRGIELPPLDDDGALDEVDAPNGDADAIEDSEESGDAD